MIPGSLGHWTLKADKVYPEFSRVLTTEQFLHAPDIHLRAILLVSEELWGCVCWRATLRAAVDLPCFSLGELFIAEAEVCMCVCVYVCVCVGGGGGGGVVRS